MATNIIQHHEPFDFESFLITSSLNTSVTEKNPKRRDSEKKVLDACQKTMIGFNNKSWGEMGTTMTMAAIEGNKALLAHCRDRRICVVRNHEIIYQSTDHVALTPEDWPIITRAFFTGRNSYIPDIK